MKQGLDFTCARLREAIPNKRAWPKNHITTVLDEAHKRQVEETMDALQEGPKGLYKRPSY